MYDLRRPGPGSAVQHALGIFVERATANGLVRIASGGQVRPSETIRYSASGVGGSLFEPPTTSRRVKFTVLDAGGQVVFGPVYASANLAGNAWIDATAPPAEGRYILSGVIEGLVRPVSTSIPFEVAANAPTPTPKPEGGFGIGLGDIKSLAILAIVAVAAVNILPALRGK